MAISFAPGQVVSHDDYIALMAQHGSPGGAKSVQALPPPKMTADELTAFEEAHDNMSPAEFYGRNPVYRYHFEDGSYVDAQADENASAQERAEGRGTLRVVDYKPAAAFVQAQNRAATAAAAADEKWYPEGTPDPNQPSGFDNSRPIMARTVNGQKEYRAPSAKELEDWHLAGQMTQNPRGQTDAQVTEAARKATADAAAAQLAPVQQATAAAQATTAQAGATTAQAEANEKAWHVAQGHGSYTHKEWDAEQRAREAAARAAPARYVEAKFDTDGRKWWGLTKDGKWEPMEGGPGADAKPTGQPGPARPRLAVGTITQTLTQYGDQLDAEVAAGRMTTAAAGARWKEAVELAPVLINESEHVQRGELGQLNASVNLATNRLSNAQSGFNAALDTINAGNSKLPAGSTLGGEAFAAMLALQLEHGRRAGGYDVRWPGGVPPVGVSPTGPTPPNAIGAGAIGAVPAPGGPPAVPPSPFPTGSGISNTTDAGGVPRERTPSSATNAPQAMAAPEPAPIAALAPYQQPVAALPPAPRFTMGAPVGGPTEQPQAVTPLGAPDPGPEPYAIMAARAQQAVPWRLSEPEYNQFRAAGVPDELIFALPRFG